MQTCGLARIYFTKMYCLHLQAVFVPRLDRLGVRVFPWLLHSEQLAPPGLLQVRGTPGVILLVPRCTSSGSLAVCPHHFYTLAAPSGTIQLTRCLRAEAITPSSTQAGQPSLCVLSQGRGGELAGAQVTTPDPGQPAQLCPPAPALLPPRPAYQGSPHAQGFLPADGGRPWHQVTSLASKSPSSSAWSWPSASPSTPR